MRIVLDTNCLLPITIPGSFGYEIWKGFRAGKFTICFSTEILLEYEEILMRISGNKEYTEAVITAIVKARNAERVVPSYRFNLIHADPDDNKFVDCAIAAGATFIVSNDKHFLELGNYGFPKVGLCSLSDFLNVVRSL